MSTTPNYSFPLIAEAQTNKFITHNDAVGMIDTVIAGISLGAIPDPGLVCSDGSALQDAAIDPTLTFSSFTIALNLARANAWTKAQRVTPVSLAASGTITPDYSASNNFATTLTGSATLANGTNANAGQAGLIVVAQGSGGSHTLNFGTAYKFAGGTAPTMSTTAGAIDVLSYYIVSSSVILVSSALGFS